MSIFKVELKKVYAIAHDVEKRLEEKESTLPTVELVQDTVEEILIEEGYVRVAKAYILYRDKRSRSRDMKSILLESIENESSDDINLFDVFENLMNDAMDKTRKEDLKKVFKLLKELNIDEEIIYQKVSETFAMTDETLKDEIKNASVFARVSPEHKVRIVKAWQKTGAVVAMTGDGVNDSPALKNADIGIAMGKTGTDVAKNASDMILADDNFITIVEAVKQGRNIYDNIKKAIHFLLATNIGEIVTIFMGLVLGFKSPLLAIQLLWVNLVTDSLPAIALGLEPAEKDIMNRKPVNSRKGLFADGLWSKIITEGILIGALTLVAFSIGNKWYGLEVGRTMAFVAIGVLELVHSFNIKSDKSIFKVGILENKFLLGSFILGVFVQTIVVIIPMLANIFKLVPLNFIQWGITLLISIIPIPVIELQKKINASRLENVIDNGTGILSKFFIKIILIKKNKIKVF